jgi:hypothetical protein
MKPGPRFGLHRAAVRGPAARGWCAWGQGAGAVCSAALVCLSAPLARADGTKDQCVDANGKGQELRREGSVSAARDQFRACAVASCPSIVRDDCTRRLDEADRAQPTVVFEVQDATGNDLSAVHTTMDGKPWTEILEGKALAADPGKHVFVFTAAGQAPVSRTVILTEGEKGRRERIVLSATPAPATPSSAAPSPARPPSAEPAASVAPGAAASPTPLEGVSGPGAAGAGSGGMGAHRIIGLTSGIAGLVGLGLGGAFGLLTTSAWNHAKSACGGNPSQCTNVPAGQSDKSTAETDATVSTVGFVAGGALLAAGAIVFFTASPGGGHATTGWTMAPSVGLREAGLTLRGGF